MPKKILIAEDDSFLTKMYKLNLDEDDWEVEIVANGEQATLSMDKEKPDILLLDLLMPKVDGFAVLEHVKRKGYTFPVIILTNLSQEVDQKKCKDLGAVGYFTKSDMDIDQLVSMVKKYVGGGSEE